MASLKATQLVRQYERGNLTGVELLHILIEKIDPVENGETVSQIPSDVLEQLRTISHNPPSTLEGWRSFHIGSYVGSRVVEGEERERRKRWLEGVWLWHSYFVNRKPLTDSPDPT